MKENLKWTNKFSGEQGYVKSVSWANKQFINTFDKSVAKVYKSDKMINIDLCILEAIGEMERNDFSRESCE